MVVGDSISAHYHPYLERHLGPSFEYAWAGGGDSSRVLTQLQDRQGAGSLDVDVMLLNCGLHDIKTDPATGAKQVPRDEYEQNLRDIVKLLDASGVMLIWVRTTPCDEAVHNKADMEFHRFAADCEAYNHAADEIMAASGVELLDLHGFTLQLGEGVYCDHVHFHDGVRQQQAAFISGWLSHWLKVHHTANDAPVSRRHSRD